MPEEVQRDASAGVDNKLSADNLFIGVYRCPSRPFGPKSVTSNKQPAEAQVAEAQLALKQYSY